MLNWILRYFLQKLEERDFQVLEKNDNRHLMLLLLWRETLAASSSSICHTPSPLPPPLRRQTVKVKQIVMELAWQTPPRCAREWILTWRCLVAPYVKVPWRKFWPPSIFARTHPSRSLITSLNDRQQFYTYAFKGLYDVSVERENKKTKWGKVGSFAQLIHVSGHAHAHCASYIIGYIVIGKCNFIASPSVSLSFNSIEFILSALSSNF